MSVFQKIIEFLQTQFANEYVPKSFDYFHIFFLTLTIVSTVLLVIFFRNTSNKNMRFILFVIWIIMVLFEIYKQIVFSVSFDDNVAVWKYQWYSFPFQFCSTPLYALPFIIFLKDGKIRDSFICFFSGFSLFAGIAVMIYPNDVFIPTIGVCIQTMIHHGSQVAIGILVAAHNRKRLNLKHLLGSLIVFYCFTAVAMGLNEVLYEYFVTNGITDQSFNMFFISPYYDCTLPILSIVHDKVPFWGFRLIYIFGFTFVSALIYFIEKGIIKLFSLIPTKADKKTNA